MINAVPFLPGYRWHRTARIWRTPLLGELAMGSTNARMLRLLSREGNATPGPMPEQWQKSVLEHFDQGTQRAILRLYRSSPPEVLAAGGRCAWASWACRRWSCGASGTRTFRRDSARPMPRCWTPSCVELADAGHWPWLDRADAIDRVVQFLGAARE